jgi:hypothetical protein
MKFTPKAKSIALAIAIFSLPTHKADAYCPSTDGTNISCSGCTMDLTCNYSGGITISNDFVTLNGHGYTLSNSSGIGVNVTGVGATINDLIVTGAGSHGIKFDDGDGEWSTISNVYVEYSGAHGIYNEENNLIVSYGDFEHNANSGLRSEDNTGLDYTDVDNTYMIDNTDGYYAWGQYFSFHRYNYYLANDSKGAYDLSGTGGSFENSYFAYNGSNGLHVDSHNSSTYPLNITDNQGYENGSADCKESGTSYIYVSGNTWDVNDGCVNVP